MDINLRIFIIKIMRNPSYGNWGPEDELDISDYEKSSNYNEYPSSFSIENNDKISTYEDFLTDEDLKEIGEAERIENSQPIGELSEEDIYRNKDTSNYWDKYFLDNFGNKRVDTKQNNNNSEDKKISKNLGSTRNWDTPF